MQGSTQQTIMRFVWKLAFVIITIAVAYLALLQETTDVKYDAYYKSDINTFFKYIADPNNFKAMNPTIIELTINSHKPNAIHIYYTEHLVQAPFIRNYAYASYNISAEPIWKIDSLHLTCFYTDFLCTPTRSTVTAKTVTEKRVHYTETITYSCPRLLSNFCKREVHLQRKLIMGNLARMF